MVELFHVTGRNSEGELMNGRWVIMVDGDVSNMVEDSTVYVVTGEEMEGDLVYATGRVRTIHHVEGGWGQV